CKSRVKQAEAHPVQPRSPEFVGPQRRHHVSLGLSEQLVNGNKLESASACALDNQRQSVHCSGAITSAIMQKDDVPASLVVERARRQVGEHVTGNLFGGMFGIVAPIVGIDLVA